MASTLPTPGDCCSSCDSVITTNVPGPAGSNGANGSNGADANDPFSLLTLAFTMPAELGIATATVDQDTWVTVGSMVGLQVAAGSTVAFLLVTDVTDATHIVLQNVENTATGIYATNPAAGTVFPVGTHVVPSGVQGPVGPAGAAGAPTAATYVLITTHASLPSAQVLDTLTTGWMHWDTMLNVIGTQALISLTTDVTGTLPISSGGTNATTAANARASLSAAARGVNSDITQLTGITTPLSVAQGGTGSATAAGARASLGAAASGANSDITSLSALSTPLSIAQGGTGAANAANARTNLGITAALRYMSPATAIPAAGAHNHHAHSLGAAPTRISGYLVCAVSDVATGVLAGDVIPLEWCTDSNGTVEKSFLQVHGDATNITVTRSADAGTLYLLRLVDGVYTAVTAVANFQYAIVAWYDS